MRVIPDSFQPYVISPLLGLLCALFGWFIAGRLHQVPFHSLLERLWLYLLLGLISLSWLGAILAALGLFRIWPLILVMLAIIFWARWPWRKLAPSPMQIETVHKPARTHWLVLVFVLVVIGGAEWLYARPSESYLLTDDSAVYTIGGISLAHTGSLWYEPDLAWSTWKPATVHIGVWDPIVTSFDDILNMPQGFIRQFYTEGIVFARYYGPFYQWSLTRPTIEIGFLAVPKIWSALVVWFFGIGAAPYATPFMGVVGLLALYAIIRRTLGWPSAIVAASLLGISLPQIWFARLSLSEIYTQVLLLGGIYLLVLLRQNLRNKESAKAIGVWASLALGALTILRFEAIVMLIPLVILMALNQQREGWERGGAYSIWLWSLVACCALGSLLSLVTTPYYMFTRLMTALSISLIRRVLVALLGALLAGLVGWRYRLKVMTLVASVVNYTRSHLGYLIAALWGIWAILATWQLATKPIGSSLAGWLGQYLTWPGLVLAILGCIGLSLVLQIKKRSHELTILLAMAIFFTWLYTVNPRVTTLHPWALRRLMPIIVPMLFFGIAAIPWCVSQLIIGFSIRQKQLIRTLLIPVGLLVLLALGWGIGQVSRPFLLYQDRKGMWGSLQAFSASLPEKALLIFNDSMESQRLTPVIELVFDRPSLVLYDNDTNATSLGIVDNTITQALQAGYEVFWITAGESDFDWRPERWSLVPYLSRGIVTPVTQLIWGRPPSKQDIVQNTIILEVSQVLPKEQMIVITAGKPISIPVSEGGYSYLTDGFNQLESDSAGRVFRWTNGLGQLKVPWPATNPASASFCMQLWVSGGRPAGEIPAHLLVQLEGVMVYDATLPASFEQIELPISVQNLSNRGSKDLEINLVSTSFTVADSGSPPVTRTLGVLFYGLTITPGEVCR